MVGIELGLIRLGFLKRNWGKREIKLYMIKLRWEVGRIRC